MFPWRHIHTHTKNREIFSLSAFTDAIYVSCAPETNLSNWKLHRAFIINDTIDAARFRSQRTEDTGCSKLHKNKLLAQFISKSLQMSSTAQHFPTPKIRHLIFLVKRKYSKTNRQAKYLSNIIYGRVRPLTWRNQSIINIWNHEWITTHQNWWFQSQKSRLFVTIIVAANKLLCYLKDSDYLRLFRKQWTGYRTKSCCRWASYIYSLPVNSKEV